MNLCISECAKNKQTNKTEFQLSRCSTLTLTCSLRSEEWSEKGPLPGLYSLSHLSSPMWLDETDPVRFCGSLSGDLCRLIFKCLIPLCSEMSLDCCEHSWGIAFATLLIGQALCSYCQPPLLLHRLQQSCVG